ncbi:MULTISPECIES: GNAT family N-acetyltransferase [Rhizobium]|uniref:GNAT family N-acetyltransferase n=1 Tax=Rhizobium TaxID=379 RepID=UPI0023621722|nr:MULTISPECIES: GNAT family N-acetyltransferase [unclassified Rhizobium]MDC9810164.1 GNAT family N-acetyltransferase [Rhizobium sp. MC62]WEA24280.1 GNAT family N-acetyltransferase [Rhizobium sp. MJ22]WEA58796.1 GNAT family N-acetyltransferase [Rhizobium sp. BJ04]
MGRYPTAIIDDEETMFETLDPVPPEIATAISDGLTAFNESAEIRREAFAIVWQENGGLTAGITASVSFSILFIGNLWVAKSLRLSGIGTKLMAAAEEEGRRRAAVTACVDTLSTQAPDFYPKLGYVEFGRISGHAAGRPVDRIWFRKELSVAA